MALDALLARHLPGLVRYLRLHVPAHLLRRENVSDIAQSVCLEVIAEPPDDTDQTEAGFRLWLFRKARDKIVDKQRYHYAAKRDPVREVDWDEADQDAPVENGSPSQRAMREEALDRLDRAFAHLSEDDRQVITLSRVVGLSRSEIADEMGRSEGAVRVLLHRALARLGKSMNDARSGR